MLTRRGLLAGAAAACITFRDDTMARLDRLDVTRATPDDEDFWRELRGHFDVAADAVSFNHAGLSPSPRAVREALAAETARANGNPSRVVFREQERELGDVRRRLATLLGVTEDEIALTPNATHGLHTTILGLDLARGDEILTTAHEYSRTFSALRQRERRDGVAIVDVPLTTPAAAPDVVAASIVDRLTPRTRLVVLSHVTYLTGQILPVRAITDVATARGVPVLVDGAHGFGLLPDTAADLGCAFYTSCLHKWVVGPIGTGVFVVRAPFVERLWPLHPADESRSRRITKFEQWGTHAIAPFLALREALAFHERIGRQRIADRLALLRARLAAAVADTRGLTLISSTDPTRAVAILAIACERATPCAVADWLWRDHRIHVTVADVADLGAIRVSPHVFTSIADVDRLAALLQHVATHGV